MSGSNDSFSGASLDALGNLAQLSINDDTLEAKKQDVLRRQSELDFWSPIRSLGAETFVDTLRVHKQGEKFSYQTALPEFIFYLRSNLTFFTEEDEIRLMTLSDPDASDEDKFKAQTGLTGSCLETRRSMAKLHTVQCRAFNDVRKTTSSFEEDNKAFEKELDETIANAKKRYRGDLLAAVSRYETATREKLRELYALQREWTELTKGSEDHTVESGQEGEA